MNFGEITLKELAKKFSETCKNISYMNESGLMMQVYYEVKKCLHEWNCPIGVKMYSDLNNALHLYVLGIEDGPFITLKYKTKRKPTRFLEGLYFDDFKYDFPESELLISEWIKNAENELQDTISKYNEMMTFFGIDSLDKLEKYKDSLSRIIERIKEMPQDRQNQVFDNKEDKLSPIPKELHFTNSGLRFDVPGKGHFEVAVGDWGGEYPGIDVEFIPEKESNDDKACGNPRILMECTGDVHAYVWSDKQKEDFTHKIQFI